MPGSIQSQSAVAIALTGALNWALQTYAFHGNVPAPVSVALYTCVPAVIGYFYTRFALNQLPPYLKRVLKDKTLYRPEPSPSPSPPPSSSSPPGTKGAA
jgi:hypothetical protein